MNSIKLSVLSVAVIFTLGMTGLIACGSDGESQSKTKTEMQESQQVEYVCPMKCEGDKTYAEAGQCPECGMDLVKQSELEEE